MGKQNDVLLDYFDDNERFADLYNATLFGGRQVINPGRLEDASERYTQRSGDKKGNAAYRARFRDVKKRLRDGGTLRILALEAQELLEHYYEGSFKKFLLALSNKRISEKEAEALEKWLDEQKEV